MTARVTISSLKAQFGHPAAEYGACPFWFWNGDLRDEELLRQIDEMHDKGIGGFVIHSRLGCAVPYLSDAWFRRCRLAVGRAQQHGMKVWLYDEDNWPSGYAGGQVVDGNPQFAARHLACERHYLDAAQSLELAVDDVDSVRAVYAMPILQVQQRTASPLEQFQGRLLKEIDWRDRRHSILTFDFNRMQSLPVRDGRLIVPARNERAGIYIFRSRPGSFCPAYSSRPYVDLMNADATRAFIRLTHENYRRHLSEWFGTTIVGFFTDEPGFYNNFLDYDAGTLPWTDDLPQQFHQQHGQDLLASLISLWEDDGPASASVRAKYWQTVQRLFRDRYIGQLAQWCEENNLKLTGHLLIEESLLAMQRFSANPFAALAPMHVPAVDKIDEQTRKISEKLVSSIAHLDGRARVLSETFALVGWKLAPAYMKRIVDYQFVRGVNWLVPHAFYYSIDGWRRNECPPSLFFQNPWWEHSRPIWDYIARLSWVLSQGTPVATVALYYPIEHAWVTVNPDSPGPTRGLYPELYVPFTMADPPHVVHQTDAAMNRIAFALAAGQYGYDFVDYTHVQQGRVDRGALCINTQRYRAVVVPPVQTMDAGAMNLLLQMAADGGVVIFAESLPVQLLAASAGDATAKRWEAIRQSLCGTATVRSIGQGAIVYVPCGVAEILNQLRQRIGPDIMIRRKGESAELVERDVQQVQFVETRIEQRADAIACQCRLLDDGRSYFLVNESADALTVDIELRGNGMVQQWCPASADSQWLPATKSGDDMLSLTLQFQPWQSRLLIVGPHMDGNDTRSQVMQTETLNDWTIEIADRKMAGGLTSWHEMGLPCYSGKAVYHGSLAIDLPAVGSARVELDLGQVFDTAQVRINGRACGLLAFGPYRIDVTDYIVNGLNKVEIEVANTLVNELQLVERPSGLLGPVKWSVVKAATGASE